MNLRVVIKQRLPNVTVIGHRAAVGRTHTCGRARDGTYGERARSSGCQRGGRRLTRSGRTRRVRRARRGSEYEGQARACVSNGAAERGGVCMEFGGHSMYGIRELALSRCSLRTG